MLQSPNSFGWGHVRFNGRVLQTPEGILSKPDNETTKVFKTQSKSRIREGTCGNPRGLKQIHPLHSGSAELAGAVLALHATRALHIAASLGCRGETLSNPADLLCCRCGCLCLSWYPFMLVVLKGNPKENHHFEGGVPQRKTRGGHHKGFQANVPNRCSPRSASRRISNDFRVKEGVP